MTVAEELFEDPLTIEINKYISLNAHLLKNEQERTQLNETLQALQIVEPLFTGETEGKKSIIPSPSWHSRFDDENLPPDLKNGKFLKFLKEHLPAYLGDSLIEIELGTKGVTRMGLVQQHGINRREKILHLIEDETRKPRKKRSKVNMEFLKQEYKHIDELLENGPSFSTVKDIFSTKSTLVLDYFNDNSSVYEKHENIIKPKLKELLEEMLTKEYEYKPSAPSFLEQNIEEYKSDMRKLEVLREETARMKKGGFSFSKIKDFMVLRDDKIYFDYALIDGIDLIEDELKEKCHLVKGKIVKAPKLSVAIEDKERFVLDTHLRTMRENGETDFNFEQGYIIEFDGTNDERKKFLDYLSTKKSVENIRKKISDKESELRENENKIVGLKTIIETQLHNKTLEFIAQEKKTVDEVISKYKPRKVKYILEKPKGEIKAQKVAVGEVNLMPKKLKKEEQIGDFLKETEPVKYKKPELPKAKKPGFFKRHKEEIIRDIKGLGIATAIALGAVLVGLGFNEGYKSIKRDVGNVISEYKSRQERVVKPHVKYEEKVIGYKTTPIVHEVVKGETLWGISGGDVAQIKYIQEKNKLDKKGDIYYVDEEGNLQRGKDGLIDIINPGQKLDIGEKVEEVKTMVPVQEKKQTYNNKKETFKDFVSNYKSPEKKETFKDFVNNYKAPEKKPVFADFVNNFKPANLEAKIEAYTPYNIIKGRKRIKEDVRNIAAELYTNSDYSVKQIAEWFDISRSSIYRLGKEKGKRQYA